MCDANGILGEGPLIATACCKYLWLRVLSSVPQQDVLDHCHVAPWAAPVQGVGCWWVSHGVGKGHLNLIPEEFRRTSVYRV